jgi:RimJ/RimL family protein N-acetyltransferase
VILLEPWTSADMPLLERLNAPEMMEHLGGPETAEQLARRLQRYVGFAASPAARMFKVVVDGAAAGSVGFWDRDWNGEAIYETGWTILPEFQGRGLASNATAMAIEIARAGGRRDAIHAFPSVDNAPSIAICRKLTFELIGECDFEYPPGHPMRCNDWRLGLRQYT